MKTKIKIITGFRSNQYFTVDGDEAHKAYHLFLNPEKRGVFENGVAIIGKNIQGVEPDYNAIMGWNPTHIIDGADWNQLRDEGWIEKARIVLQIAKETAYQVDKNPELLTQKLSETKNFKLQIAPETVVPVLPYKID